MASKQPAAAGRPASDDDEDDPFASDVDLTGVQDPTADEIDEWATLDASENEDEETADKRAAAAPEAKPKAAAEPAPQPVAAAPPGKPAEPEAPKPPPPAVPAAPATALKPAQPTATTATGAAEAPSVDKATEGKMDTPPSDPDSPAPPSPPAPLPATSTPEHAPAVAAAPAAEAPSAAVPGDKAGSHAPAPPSLDEIQPAPSPGPAVKQPLSAARRTTDDEYEDDDLFGEEDLASGDAGAQDKRQQQEGSGAGWGTGWGGGWGLGALGGKLRQVAAGAVRDVQELSTSFQQVLADVTGAEEEVEKAARLSAMDEEEEGRSGAKDGDAEGAAAATSKAPTAPPAPATGLTRDVAGRSKSSSGGGAAADAAAAAPKAGDAVAAASSAAALRAPRGAPPQRRKDEALETGLQAIDAQVEQLATGAAKALSSLWGGLSSVARVVAQEVVASVQDVQHSEAVRGVAQIGSRIATTAERGLERVGRTAMVLLEEVAGGRQRVWGEEADLRAADMGRDPVTFQDFFYIYGGEQLAEELEQLSNECAQLCNKSRAKLEDEQRQVLDARLAQLGPYFNDLWDGNSPGVQAAVPQPGAEGPGAEGDEAALAQRKSSSERIRSMYDPVGYLCEDSLARADNFTRQLLEAAKGAQISTSASDDVVLDPAGKRAAEDVDDDDEGSSEQDDDDEEEEGEERPVRQRRKRDPQAELLASFRLHIAKRLAEICTAQLQLLLNLGASLAAPARTGRPADDGIPWPHDSLQQAAVLSEEAQRMVADLRSVTAAYVSALQSSVVIAATPPAEPAAPAGEGESKQEAVAEAEGGSQENATTATAQQGGAPAATAGKGGSKAASDEKASPAAAGPEGGAPGGAGAAVDVGLAEATHSQGDAAVGHVRGAYKGLLYTVLLRNVVMEIAATGGGDDEDDEEEEEASEAEQEPLVGRKAGRDDDDLEAKVVAGVAEAL